MKWLFAPKKVKSKFRQCRRPHSFGIFCLLLPKCRCKKNFTQKNAQEANGPENGQCFLSARND